MLLCFKNFEPCAFALTTKTSYFSRHLSSPFLSLSLSLSHSDFIFSPSSLHPLSLLSSLSLSLSLSLTSYFSRHHLSTLFLSSHQVYMAMLVKDKSEKHLIMMEQNGLSRWTYWAVTYIFNLMLYAVIAIIITVFSLAFQIRLFTQVRVELASPFHSG